MSAPDTAASTLNERLEFVGIDEGQRRALRLLAPTIKSSLSGALDTFYAKVRRHPGTAKFFKGEEHVQMAKGRQTSHWETIASAKYDQTYVDGVQAIGRTHARLGLEPRWYIGGYALMIESIIHAVVDGELKGYFLDKKRKKLGEDLSVVVKAALLDMDYAISIYLEALEQERAKSEAQRAAAKADQDAAMAGLQRVLSMLAKGDLTKSLNEPLADEFGELKRNFNMSLESLNTAMSQIELAVGQVLSQSTELAGATDDMAKRTERQATALEETAAALEEIASIARQAEARTGEVQAVVDRSAEEAERSGAVVEDAIKAMGDIVESSRRMNEIIGVIDEIAFQTNLLALNAGVEAARAGEQGKGFAVVAQEVRELAQRSARAAKEIKQLITRSSQDVERGVELVNTTGTALRNIGAQVGSIRGHMKSITQSSAEQATGIAEINSAVANMDLITQQNAAMVEQSSAATQNLTEEAGKLSHLVAGFVISSDRGPTRDGHQDIARPRLRARSVVAGNGQLAVKPEWTEF